MRYINLSNNMIHKRTVNNNYNSNTDSSQATDFAVTSEAS